MSVTIKDISKFTGLAVGTISKYINGGKVKENNQKLIEEAIKKLGFVPNKFARSLKTGKSKTVAILVPEITNLFATHIISYVQKILNKEGFTVQICDYHKSDEELSKLINSFIANQIDGIIHIPVSNEYKHLQKAIDNGIPIIVIDKLIENFECDYIIINNKEVAQKAVEKLIDKGYKNIALINFDEKVYTAKQRKQGYLNALKNANLEINPKIMVNGETEIGVGYLLTKEILDSNEKVDAIFATNYFMTVGAIMAINEKGYKIPDDIALSGFDNIDINKVFVPSITTIDQKMEEIATKTAEVLLSRMYGNKTEYVTEIIKANYIKGNSI